MGRDKGNFYFYDELKYKLRTDVTVHKQTRLFINRGHGPQIIL